ncbi:hypothetical protein M378DRAFT_163150 [Amanita muscaria Koide BX008]|uniref:Uncharacterized protein n=1 Tax=Amanita muscaria (strain Koide BX008) TaxID=946122 RepID=A0A0C2X564_AMAMK|nr:hypothetical protein M378DRAFT_163150 [Amanita muscaria Koide BX008]
MTQSKAKIFWVTKATNYLFILRPARFSQAVNVSPRGQIIHWSVLVPSRAHCTTILCSIVCGMEYS